LVFLITLRLLSLVGFFVAVVVVVVDHLLLLLLLLLLFCEYMLLRTSLLML